MLSYALDWRGAHFSDTPYILRSPRIVRYPLISEDVIGSFPWADGRPTTTSSYRLAFRMMARTFGSFLEYLRSSPPQTGDTKRIGDRLDWSGFSNRRTRRLGNEGLGTASLPITRSYTLRIGASTLEGITAQEDLYKQSKV